MNLYWLIYSSGLWKSIELKLTLLSLLLWTNYSVTEQFNLITSSMAETGGGQSYLRDFPSLFVRSSASVLDTAEVLELQLNIQRKNEHLWVSCEKLQSGRPGPREDEVYMQPEKLFLISQLFPVYCIFGGPVAVPAAGIEWLIIKFDLRVCFDYCSALTRGPRGRGGCVNRPTLVGNSSSVCLCFVCLCLLRRPRSALASAVTMVFPDRDGPDQWKSLWGFGKMRRGTTVGKDPGNVWPQMRSCQHQTRQSTHEAT